MTSSRAYLAYCFGAVAALLAACARDIADTQSDPGPSPEDQDPSDSGGSSNPYGWDGAAGPEAVAPLDSGSGFDSGPVFDGGNCGADLLDDRANCGVCGHDCLGGECHSGRCQATVVASGLPFPYGIAVVGSTLYFGSQGNGPGTPGAIWSTPTSGDAGLPTPIVTQNGPYLLAADAQNVYWTNQQTNSVFRAPVTGGAAVEIAPGQSRPSGIAVTATHVYWTTYGGGQIQRTAVPGGGVIDTLAWGQAGPAGLAVDAQYVYFANFDGGTIARVPIAGGAVATLAQGQKKPIAIAIDGTSVYWTSDADGSVSSCPIAQGGAVSVLAPPSLGPPAAQSLGVAVDGPRVFFSRSYGDTGIYSAPLVPGSLTPIARPQDAYPSAIAQDAKAIYFTSFTTGGVVMKVAK